MTQGHVLCVSFTDYHSPYHNVIIVHCKQRKQGAPYNNIKVIEICDNLDGENKL